jgi:hypothetical protein
LVAGLPHSALSALDDAQSGLEAAAMIQDGYVNVLRACE